MVLLNLRGVFKVNPAFSRRRPTPCSLDYILTTFNIDYIYLYSHNKWHNQSSNLVKLDHENLHKTRKRKQLPEMTNLTHTHLAREEFYDQRLKGWRYSQRITADSSSPRKSMFALKSQNRKTTEAGQSNFGPRHRHRGILQVFNNKMAVVNWLLLID